MLSRIRGLCKDFYGYSTLHGLHFLFDSPWYLRRAIWFLLLTFAACVFISKAFEGCVKWSKHEVFISTKFEIDNDLRFPAVTVCNYNMLKQSKIIGKDGQRWLDGQDLKLIKDWPNIHSKINASFDIAQEIYKNGHGAKDVIKEMKVDTMCTGLNTTTFLDSLSGMCHTINIKEKVRKIGKSYGLTLMLDAEPHEYYGTYSWEGAGFKLAVHETDERPFMDWHGIDIPTGFRTSIRIKKKKKIHKPSPYPTNCGEKKLKSSKVYTQNKCLIEEYANILANQCNCRILGFPVLSEKSVRYCSIQNITGCAHQAIWKHNSKINGCPIDCTSVSYDLQTSSIVFPSRSVEISSRKTDFCGEEYDFEKEFNRTKSKDESYLEWYRGRYARVMVFFASREVELIQELPAFDDLDLAGNIGGNMGLYLGCSVLTLLEFIDLIVLVIIQWFKKKNNKVSEQSTTSVQTNIFPLNQERKEP